MKYQTAEEVVTDKLTEFLAKKYPVIKEMCERSAREGRFGRNNLAYASIEMLSLAATPFTSTVSYPHYYSTQIGGLRGVCFDFRVEGLGLPTKSVYEKTLEVEREIRSSVLNSPETRDIEIPENPLKSGIEDDVFGWYIQSDIFDAGYAAGVALTRLTDENALARKEDI